MFIFMWSKWATAFLAINKKKLKNDNCDAANDDSEGSFVGDVDNLTTHY